MIIDSHVHLKHGNVERTEYRPEQIVEIMDAAGVDRSVVFAMSTTTRRSIEMAAEAAETCADRLIPYVYALPGYERPVIDELEEALDERGFHGIKIHIGECRLHPYIADPVFTLAGDFGVPVLMDLGGDLATGRRLASDFPETKLIVAHFGRYLCTDRGLIDSFIQLAEDHPNVWLDASGVVLDWTIEDAVGRIGAERVLFGTDGPHPMPDLVRYVELAIQQIEMLKVSDQEKEMILGGSIAQLLGL
ncbi:MAG: amidohydrolase family protein [Armatimonadota bacterium]|nr:amidohydrolase family protein [Armatimonadota bacterium]